MGEKKEREEGQLRLIGSEENENKRGEEIGDNGGEVMIKIAGKGNRDNWDNESVETQKRNIRACWKTNEA